MERNMVSQAHEALQAAHQALRAEAQQAGEISAEQRRKVAARDEAKDAEEAAAVAQLHARMGELQVSLLPQRIHLTGTHVQSMWRCRQVPVLHAASVWVLENSPVTLLHPFDESGVIAPQN